jgi:hypothetical protein
MGGESWEAHAPSPPRRIPDLAALPSASEPRRSPRSDATPSTDLTIVQSGAFSRLMLIAEKG